MNIQDEILKINKRNCYDDIPAYLLSEDKLYKNKVYKYDYKKESYVFFCTGERFLAKLEEHVKMFGFY